MQEVNRRISRFVGQPNETPVLTPVEVRTFLIAQGILPTPEQAKETFWSLGDNWWMQLIDGKWQKYGPRVFDEGLHRGNA